jgi:hypothetical protein
MSVDARALNRRVWDRFVDSLAEEASLRLLEVGGGTGATLQRIVPALRERGIESLTYTLVDQSHEAIEAASSSLGHFAQQQGFTVRSRSPQVWSSPECTVTVHLVAEDLYTFASQCERELFDAVIGQALFDLLDIPDAFDALRPLLRANGLWYLPIHFDGVTSFEPRFDPDLDEQIERLYHESMADPEDGGKAGAHTGRRLLSQLRAAGETLLTAGGSDWVVHPRANDYPDDEAYFLHQILHFVETELDDHPELNQQDFRDWLAHRRQQIDDGELIYIAHQLDVLARAPDRREGGHPSKSGASST